MRSWHRRLGVAAPDLSKAHAAPRELEMAKGISPAGELSKVVSYEGLRVVREGAVVPPQRRSCELAQGERCRVDLPPTSLVQRAASVGLIYWLLLCGSWLPLLVEVDVRTLELRNNTWAPAAQPQLQRPSSLPTSQRQRPHSRRTSPPATFAPPASGL